MKRKHLNLLLVAVVAGLAAALYFGRAPETLPAPLTPYRQADVTHIALQVGDTAIALDKRDERWWLTQPVETPADPLEVNSLLRIATQDSFDPVPAGEVDLAGLGLSAPGLVLQLDDVRIAFGDNNPISFRRYAQVGDTVFQVDSPAGVPQDGDYSNLVAKTLVPPGTRLQRIALPGLTVMRDEASWQLEPPDTNVTTDRVQTLVDHWHEARVMWNSLLEDTAAEGEPVTLGLADGSEVELRLVQRDPHLVFAQPALGIRRHVSKALTESLLALPPEEEAATTGPETEGE